ncbi:hypothetical protein ACG5V6_25685 [Streptomyces chitinivorans]|uniref:Uncharacterized protein n=1 Tax=Streptomyces chitinivorans TaxID=1257027 RepID=A0ABW7I0S9_9ACTN|nr:hypothetical protein [Streptomyces chitinivorans]MDH2407675.1 hypothetical protein [Streptomyces chitinivorans]
MIVVDVSVAAPLFADPAAEPRAKAARAALARESRLVGEVLGQ